MSKEKMTNVEKSALIQPWVNPEERITVDFSDTRGLTAQVTGCTEYVVHLTFSDSFPHMKKRMTIPLSLVTIGVDRQHYTRDPDTPLQWRLKLRVDKARPDDYDGEDRIAPANTA